VKIIGNIIIYIALFVVYSFSGLSGHSGFTFGGFLLSLVIATPLLLLGGWLVSSHEKAEQAVLDADVQKLASGGDLASNEQFFLYLRPFSSTNAYRLSDSHLNLFSWELWERDGFDDIERIVARALRPTAKLVALGTPGEHRGAARMLTTENDWQIELSSLAKKAKLIILIPSHRPGTLWELAHIKKNRYFNKVVCIMPPSDNFFYITDKCNTKSEWEQAREACMGLDIELPKHSAGGALFMINQVTGQIASQALPQPNPIAWMKSIQSLLDVR
jgi:hypothetical protein